MHKIIFYALAVSVFFDTFLFLVIFYFFLSYGFFLLLVISSY